MNRKFLLSVNVLMTSLLASCGVVSDSLESVESTSSEQPSSEPTSVPSSASSEDITSESSSSVQQESSDVTSSPEEVSSPSVDVGIEVNENFNFASVTGNATVEEKTKLGSYTPTTFAASSYNQTKSNLADGVDLVKCDLTINGTSSVTTAYVVEVDLSIANIVAGSYDNTVSESGFAQKSVPVRQAEAWERDNPDKKAIAVTNADFFGSTTVNAFVKDGVILKSAHNNTANDLPESSPMLFGVSSAGARIGAMTTTGDRNTDYTSALSYNSSLSLYNSDGQKVSTLSGGNINQGSNTTYSLCTKTDKNFYFMTGTVYKVKLIQQDESNEIRGCIVEKQEISKMTSFKLNSGEDDGYAYFATNKNMNVDFEVGTYLNNQERYVTSPKGGIWDYYDTIIGCRHSLVENGILAPTLSSESSNGAKSRVPRTAVGIKDDGKVVIVSVEDLHYGGKATTCTGMNLTQLADFMRYYGCYDAANFDGGGSSQLCTKVNGLGSWVVQTRSSDTGSTSSTSTRAVLNSIIVTTK